MKKPYSSPELDLIRMDFSTVLCTGVTPSAENVVPGVEELIEEDDIG